MASRVALIVDDEEPVRTYVQMILSGAGFHTLTATNGNVAFALVERLSGLIDLIVSDVKMPGGDGVALAYSVASSYPHIPLILMSGYSEPLIEVRATFLAKPFMPTQLMELVRRVCPAQKTMAAC